jgi:hypothetical protein
MTGVPFAIEKHIIDTLTGNSASVAVIEHKIFPSLAPTGTEAPYVILAQRSTGKLLGFGEVSKPLLMDIQLYNIKVVVKQGGYAEADRIFSKVYAALIGSSDQIPAPDGNTYHVAVASLEDDIRFESNDGERRNFHVGGVFQIVVSPPRE